MRVVVTGSSGLIGTAVRRRLTELDHEVTRLVRRDPEDADEARWDPTEGSIDAAALDGADAVVHLAGRSIGAARWSDAEKKAIYDSRVPATKLLAEAMASVASPPSAFLSGSAIGYYGDQGDTILDESAPPGDDFLARLTVDWEAATAPAAAAGIRVALLRTGIVLDPSSGLLGKMLLPFKLGVGGRVGKGDQWWSWIGIDDEVGAILHLLETEVDGPVNLVAPNPVTNAEFTDVIGDVVNRPTLIPVPRLALDLLYGKELSEALAFTSQRVDSSKLEQSGYEFRHPELRQALEALL